MHSFGHAYLNDEGTLRRVLTRAGFRQVVRCEAGMSKHGCDGQNLGAFEQGSVAGGKNAGNAVSSAVDQP